MPALNSFADPEGEVAFVSVTGTAITISGTSGSPTTVATADPILCSGTTRFRFEFFAPHARTGSADQIYAELKEDGSIVPNTVAGIISGSGASGQALKWELFKTPSAGFHTYAIVAYRSANNGTLYTTGDGFAPIFFRISRA